MGSPDSRGPSCRRSAVQAGGARRHGGPSPHLPVLFLYSMSKPVMMLFPSNRWVQRRFMLRAFTSRISSSGGSGGSGQWQGEGAGVRMAAESLASCRPSAEIRDLCWADWWHKGLPEGPEPWSPGKAACGWRSLAAGFRGRGGRVGSLLCPPLFLSPFWRDPSQLMARFPPCRAPRFSTFTFLPHTFPRVWAHRSRSPASGGSNVLHRGSAITDLAVCSGLERSYHTTLGRRESGLRLFPRAVSCHLPWVWSVPHSWGELAVSTRARRKGLGTWGR